MTKLLVAPITHAEPKPDEGVLIPPSVKRHLGLDDEPSWIITTEINQFIWPGPDVRTVEGGDSPLFGTIPTKLYEQMRLQISDNVDRYGANITPRDE